MKCKFCNKETKNERSTTQHEIRCKSNPNKIEVKPTYGMLGKKGTNQFIRAKQNNEVISVSDSTKKKISEQSKKQIWDDQRKERHSIAMKEAVMKHKESYTSSNRGRTKQIVYNGVKFQGRWELAFYIWCNDNGISIVRNESWFDYEWNGKRKYNPDFYLPDLDCYVEVKGYKTDRDQAKWDQFPYHLKIISKNDIKEIRENRFSSGSLVSKSSGLINR